MSAFAAAARVLAEVAKHGPEVLETAEQVAKFGTAAVDAVHAWVNGDGPEPAELAAVPDTTRMKLSQARLERLAASGTGG